MARSSPVPLRGEVSCLVFRDSGIGQLRPLCDGGRVAACRTLSVSMVWPGYYV